VELGMQLPVVMGQREVDRLDPLPVLVRAGDPVEAPDAVGGGRPQFLLERLDKSGDEVEIERVGGLDDIADPGVHQGREYYPQLPVKATVLVDASGYLRRIYLVIDEGKPHIAQFQVLELAQERGTEGFGGNAGDVGNDEGGPVGRIDAAQRVQHVTSGW